MTYAGIARLIASIGRDEAEQVCRDYVAAELEHVRRTREAIDAVLAAEELPNEEEESRLWSEGYMD